MKLNFVLIDFESLQPTDLELLRGGSNKIKVFVGNNQAKFSAEIAMTIQKFGSDAEYIRIDGNGKNALDFHIAFYLGRVAKEHPDASFHIISKDTGFDPLIRHLNTQKISCQRIEEIANISPTKAAKPLSIAEKCNVVIDKLNKGKKNRPQKEKKLQSFINASFPAHLLDEDVKKIIEQLTKRKILKIADGKVQYELPS